MIGDFREATLRRQLQNTDLANAPYQKLLEEAMYRRDVFEYATFQVLLETQQAVRDKGNVLSVELMQEFRDNWKDSNGNPMDFTRTIPNTGDIRRLLESTGLDSFGRIDISTPSNDSILAVWGEAVNTYKERRKQGDYLHVITDPELRSHMFNHGGQLVNYDRSQPKAIAVHKGSSLRSKKIGDKVVLHDRVDSPYRYEATIRNAIPTPETPVRKTVRAFAESLRNPESVQNTQTQNTQPAQSQNPFRGNTPPANAPSQEAPEPEMSEDFTDEELLGWSGGKLDGKQYRGLSHVIGAYLTKADAEEVAKNFDEDVIIPSELADASLELLKHMRSNGYDFSLKQSAKKNQIDVKIASGERPDLRVFDMDNNGRFIGRVYDKYNVYNINIRANKARQASIQHTAEDAKLILDYVTGREIVDPQTGKVVTGKVRKTARDSSYVRFDNLTDNKQLYINPNTKSYRAIVYKDAQEAEEFIRNGIAEAKAYVDSEFQAEEIQALIDKHIEAETVTSEEFLQEMEELYSLNEAIRQVQEEAIELRLHSDDNGLEHLESYRDDIIGNYEDGFNPAFVTEHMNKTDRGNERDAMLAAIKTAGYDRDKIKGNDFAVNNMKERLVEFDPDTAKSIEQVKEENEKLYNAMKVVQDTLIGGGMVGKSGTPYIKEPTVEIDENGVIRWEGERRMNSGSGFQRISGEIGQVMVPDEHGIIKTKFQGENNYGFVPGYTGYFTFEGDYDNRMERFRVKGFEEHLNEKLRAQTLHQMTRPFDKDLNNIPATLGASSINNLYHGDVYGKRIEMDFMETSQLNQETKEAILKTMSNRVRFDNQFSEHATTSAETQANREYSNNEDTSSFSYWKAAGESNMRVLGKEFEDEHGNPLPDKGVDIENYADLTMTGTGKTQGLIWYLADGAKVNSDGSVTPSKGMMNEKGELVPDKTAVKKLDYFDKEQYNAWDRTQMSANQLMTALRVDEGVNTTLMSFGGWTFDDSYAVSKEFAERNQVFGEKPNENSMRVLREVMEQNVYGTPEKAKELMDESNMVWSSEVISEGREILETYFGENSAFDSPEFEAFLEEHGRFRPLQRGDKLSDFGGNKGTIGIVIDRDMSPEEAKAQKLEKEVAFMKANPELDVISAPYSMLSRHNAGVVKELMEGEPQDLVNPEDPNKPYKAAMGKLNLIVTDMVVDDKTHAYTREDVLDGKGRKASGQLAWALQSKDAKAILGEIYGNNDGAWETYREFLIATGLDMKPDGTIVEGYEPHAGEEREHFAYDPEMDSHEFLNQIQKQGGFLDLPFEVEFKNGLKSNEMPILSASLRQDVELIDGTMRRSDYTNQYMTIYDEIGKYMNATSEEDKVKAQAEVQKQYDSIQSTIIDRQFNGGHNGKNSFIRDNIMGKRMQNSATGVAVVDPRLNIGEAGMNQDMMDALNAKEGDTVMMFRDPVWRDGAIRAMKVVKDDTVHGVAFNPISDKSHDGDFDGDTYGLIKFDSKAANRELINKFSHEANMIDKGNGKDELYFQDGMDLASAMEKAKEHGDDRPEKLLEEAHAKALSNDPRSHRQALKKMNEYTQTLFREYSFGADYVSLENDDAVFNSFEKMVNNGSKGKPTKVKEDGTVIPGSLDEYKDYHNGKKTDKDARDVQYATGVKSDDTGLAGAFSQKLVSVMRNENIQSALEAMYPVTQGTLQIKKDPKHAWEVNQVLTDTMNKTFNGKDMNNPKKGLTPPMFKKQLTKILEEDMRVSVAEEHIDAVTEVLTVHDKGVPQMVPLKEAVALKGSPMDRVAYGGGYDELVNLSKNNESLLTGEYNRMFAPKSMREADAKTKIAKRDTQRIAVETENATVLDKQQAPQQEPVSTVEMEAEPEFSL